MSVDRDHRPRAGGGAFPVASLRRPSRSPRPRGRRIQPRFHGPLHAGEIAQSRHSVAVGRGLRQPIHAACASRDPSGAAGHYPCADGTPRPAPRRGSRVPSSSSVAPSAAAAARFRASSPASARGLVEAVLGRKPVRRQLTLDFEPAMATSWELLIDGASFFPRLLEDIDGGDVGRPHPDLRVQGRRDRQPVPRPPGRQGRRRASASGSSPRRRFSQPASGRRRSTTRSSTGGVQVVANQGAFLDLDGPLGDRKIDWRFDDLGHFDHRKVVVVDGRVGFVGGPGIEDHYADRDARPDAPPRGPDRRPAPGGVPALVALPGRLAAGDRRGTGPVLPASSPPAGRRDGDPPQQPGRGPPADRGRLPRRGRRRQPPPLCHQPVPRRPHDPARHRGRRPARRRRPGHRPGRAPLAAREGGRAPLVQGHAGTPAPTSANTPRWPTRRSSSPTTPSSPGRRTSTR